MEKNCQSKKWFQRIEFFFSCKSIKFKWSLGRHFLWWNKVPIKSSNCKKNCKMCGSELFFIQTKKNKKIKLFSRVSSIFSWLNVMSKYKGRHWWKKLVLNAETIKSRICELESRKEKAKQRNAKMSKEKPRLRDSNSRRETPYT